MEEIKKYESEEWGRKYPGENFSAWAAVNYSNKVDDALQECENILNKVSLSIEYTSIKEEMKKVIYDAGVLCNYVGGIGLDIAWIDTELHDDFTKNATETVSRIKADEIVTTSLDPNDKITLTINEEKMEQPRYQLTFEDFMKENDDIGGLARNKFAELFKVQYDNAVASGNIQSDVDYDKYVEALIKEGSFDHTIDTKVASFISDLLDVTIVKPILEAIIGVDLITHDDLNGIEICFKLGMAVIDIMTLGQAGIFEGGLKAGAKSLLKSMGIEFLSNGAALTVNKAGEMLNIPGGRRSLYRWKNSSRARRFSKRPFSCGKN